MEWFERLTNNPHTQMVIIANNRGQLLRASQPLRSDSELLASMFQSLFVLAQTLIHDFKHESARFVLLSTKNHHIFLFTLRYPIYYVAIVVDRSAPLMLVMVELERVFNGISPADVEMLDALSNNDDLNAAELIEAVQEWLRERPSDSF